ncbi:hypothetical protein AVEN_236420-1 [Araneus ventricosus]|uniref:DUF5641 domain-containing protein n=1 Tax=Araneus ventricosus TaxID=182803 RepID=A0A4Y2ITJ8_ARAVE|nr:hypothetical protein AVEN_236420-1 [Araneus ventricosus]
MMNIYPPANVSGQFKVDDRYPRNMWTMGKITETHPGRDATRKRKHYLGDFDDMNSPIKARKLLSIAQNQQKKLKMKIKNDERKTKKLGKKLFTLKRMLSDLKKKRQETEPATNVLKV